MDASLSLPAACAVIDGYGMGDNTMTAILHCCKDRGLIRDGRIMQSQLDEVIQAHRLVR
ncbi:hypothetical protein [Novosphingobium rosa]|uniref:hypothetical protein n=1 Tax=Novosphingobium rosa TaxID=76978 RepID=UPI000A4C1837|nr:hypothetical protein [Novosphingobium rosa]